MLEKKPPIRYPRPALEIEVDLQKLTQPGCCRFVPIVIRLVHIPYQMNVSLLITLWRVRIEGTDTYQEQPAFYHPPAIHTDTDNSMWELDAEMLARAHTSETGIVSIVMSSAFGTELSKAEYQLDSREATLTEKLVKGFTTITIFDHILSDEERKLRAIEREQRRSSSSSPHQPTLF